MRKRRILSNVHESRPNKYKTKVKIILAIYYWREKLNGRLPFVTISSTVELELLLESPSNLTTTN